MQAQNIQDVLKILSDVIAAYRDRDSPLAFFPAVYRATTSRVQAGIDRGAFADPDRMALFVTTFANRYLLALDSVGKIGDAAPARAWQAAFDVESRPHTMILQHVLLGMNAHINFDLPMAVVDVAKGGSLQALHDDFLAINLILAQLLHPVQDVIDEFSPLLKVLDDIGGRSDEHLITFSLKMSREEAWHEATRLATEDEVQQKRSLATLDRKVAFFADRIIVPDGAMGAASNLIARTESTNVKLVTDALLSVV